MAKEEIADLYRETPSYPNQLVSVTLSIPP
jgi:hypothetical protein